MKKRVSKSRQLRRIKCTLLLSLACFLMVFISTCDASSRIGHCINNLRQIEHAKLIYLIKNNLNNAVEITWKDIAPFITDSENCRCPDNGKYTINPAGVFPDCSVYPHSLEESDEYYRKLRQRTGVISAPIIATCYIASWLLFLFLSKRLNRPPKKWTLSYIFFVFPGVLPYIVSYLCLFPIVTEPNIPAWLDWFYFFSSWFFCYR